MLGTRLYWLEGPWRGKLAMAARPRGGDWLPDEIAAWQVSGVETVLSLLEAEEEHELDLRAECAEVRARRMTFRSFPIADRDIPRSGKAFSELLFELDTVLSQGKNVVVHCRQGIGRTGLVAAGLFIMNGLEPSLVFDRLSATRELPVPETMHQKDWLIHFAETLALPG